MQITIVARLNDYKAKGICYPGDYLVDFQSVKKKNNTMNREGNKREKRRQHT